MYEKVGEIGFWQKNKTSAGMYYSLNTENRIIYIFTSVTHTTVYW